MTNSKIRVSRSAIRKKSIAVSLLFAILSGNVYIVMTTGGWIRFGSVVFIMFLSGATALTGIMLLMDIEDYFNNRKAVAKMVNKKESKSIVTVEGGIPDGTN